MENSDGVHSAWGMEMIIANAVCLPGASTTQDASQYVVGQTKSAFNSAFMIPTSSESAR